MKYFSSQLAFFLKERGVKRNLGFFFHFMVILITMIAVFTVLFQYLMDYEGRSYSWITGLYWTLTVMSTLGFGDITFTSDPGKLFSIIVLVSGILCLMVMLPFAFVQHIYSPWLEMQKKRTVPRSVPEGLRGHIVVVGVTPASLELVDDLTRYGFTCVILTGDNAGALDLMDQGYHMVLGDYDDSRMYRRLNIADSVMLVVMENDIRNTNVVFSVRAINSSLPIVTRADKVESVDILQLAGASLVVQSSTLLGEALAQRVALDRARSHILRELGSLMLAEAPARGSKLAGTTIRDCGLRQCSGVNIVGLLEHNSFTLPHPDSRITEKTKLVLAGTREQLLTADRIMHDGETPHDYEASKEAVIIIGGGQVGIAAARSLRAQNRAVVIVDQRKMEVDEGIGFIQGDAADLGVMERAGIRVTPSVIITTHDDDTNIYLTIYYRRLRSDLQIISRSNHDRNVGILQSAGATMVLSLVSMMSGTILNMLSPGRVFMLSEGYNLFRAGVGSELAGKSLKNSNIRTLSGCSVVAMCHEDGEMSVNPEPDYIMREGDTLYLVGDIDSQSHFYAHFGNDNLSGIPCHSDASIWKKSKGAIRKD